MTLHVKDGGTWRQAVAVSVKSAGTWRTIQEVYVRVAGAWQSVFSAWSLSTFGQVLNESFLLGDTCYVGARFNPDGTIDHVLNNSTTWNQIGVANWATGAPPATYYIRATLSAGSTPTTGTMNTWEALSSARFWRNSRSTLGTKTSTLLIEISSSATGPADSSGTYQIGASIEA